MKRKSELRKLNLLWIVLLALAIVVFAETSVQSGETNLTIWDESDTTEVYDSLGIWIYANFSEAQ